MMPGLRAGPTQRALSSASTSSTAACLSQLRRLEPVVSRWPHRPPTHPDAVADRIRQRQVAGHDAQPADGQLREHPRAARRHHARPRRRGRDADADDERDDGRTAALMMGGGTERRAEQRRRAARGSPRSDDNGERFRARDLWSARSAAGATPIGATGTTSGATHDDYYRRRDRRGHDDERRECEPSHKPAIARPAAPGDLSAHTPPRLSPGPSPYPHPAPRRD